MADLFTRLATHTRGATDVAPRGPSGFEAGPPADEWSDSPPLWTFDPTDVLARRDERPGRRDPDPSPVRPERSPSVRVTVDDEAGHRRAPAMTATPVRPAVAPVDATVPVQPEEPAWRDRPDPPDPPDPLAQAAPARPPMVVPARAPTARPLDGRSHARSAVPTRSDGRHRVRPPEPSQTGRDVTGRPGEPARASRRVPTSAPPVHITIGRIEVRASPAPPPVPPTPAPAAPAPTPPASGFTLAAYLRGDDGRPR